MTHAQLLPEIFKLSEAEQVLIADAIHQRLIGLPEAVNEQEFREELRRLQSEADADPSSVVPLAKVMEKLRSRK
jgi:putative addiction module component (TIGR02574 family)